jgi:solute carrier family 13 (sodium-dependent dicarboxylate transporter), member 2/3/5
MGAAHYDQASQQRAMTTTASPASATEFQRTPYVAWAGQVLCVIVPVAIWFAPLGLAPQVQHGFAILAFMVIAWITEATEFAIAGFIGCFLFWALGVVKFEVAFSGFADATAWFLFAAMLIGLVASKSGLARRLAYTIMLHVGVTYPRILFGMIVTDFLLTFIVPSGLARVVILASIALALTEAFRAERGSNIARGMFLILTYTGNIFDKMILAGAGSITAAGQMHKFGGIEVSYAVWLLAFLPASIITVLAAWRLTLWLYPPEQSSLSHGRDYFQAELDKMGPWSLRETKAAIFVGCAILLWVTDFLHHIPPTMVALGVGLAATLPHIGILDADDVRGLNYMPVFFVAAAVSMGNVLEATKGLDVLTSGVFHWMTPLLTNIFSITAVLYWAAFLYHFLLASEISMLGTSIPLVMDYAKSHGLNPLQLGLIWSFAAGGKLFAYQSGVLIVGYSYGYFEARDLVRIGAWLTVVEFAVLMLLVPFWWPLIGIH